MDLKRLNHLIALAEERNFGRAARRVHLSQPAFSRSVQAAEVELKLQLFERGNAEISCTPAGSFVIERARKLLLQSQHLARDVDLYRERVMGDVSFGASPFPAATLLPQLMVNLRTRFPKVNSRVHVNNCRFLTECLRKEEIDFFVADARDVPIDANFELTPIGRQRARFYVRAGHPLGARGPLRLAELVSYGLASTRLPAQAEAGLRKLMGRPDDKRLHIAVQCDDVQLVKRIALDTDTVMVGTEGIVREELAAGTLQLLHMQGLQRFYAEVSVVKLQGRSYSPMAEYTVDFLTQLAASMEDATDESVT